MTHPTNEEHAYIHPGYKKPYPIETVLRDLAAQEGCDGEPYDAMVFAAAAIAALRTQLAEAHNRIVAMESGDWSEVKLVRFENGQMDISAGPISAIAEYLAQMMQDGEGKYFNYMEVAIDHKTAGPMTLSLQRKNGKTPNQLRKEANARADRAEAALAAQIEADADAADRISNMHGKYAETGIDPQRSRDIAMQIAAHRVATAIRNQPHDRTALDRMLAEARAQALRDAADAVLQKTYRPYAPKDFRDGYDVAKADVATAILAMIPKEGA